MSNLKCPFCQQELVRHWGMEEPALYCCDNPKCSRGGVATESAWQELINERQHATDCQDLFIAAMAQKLETETELERTRKALDVIKKEMSRETMPDFAVIHNALKGVSDE